MFILLTEVLCELKEFDEAKKILNKAVAEFQGTASEVKVIIGQANMFMKMGDLKKALNMLKKVDQHHPNYIEAKKKMADIYLQELRDRKSYT